MQSDSYPLRLMAAALCLGTVVCLPLFMFTLDVAVSRDCTPDISRFDPREARGVALFGWAVSGLGVGLILALVIRLRNRGSQGVQAILIGFVLWKVIHLALAFRPSPYCFESYSYLSEREVSGWDTALGWLGILSWVALIVMSVILIGPLLRWTRRA